MEKYYSILPFIAIFLPIVGTLLIGIFKEKFITIKKWITILTTIATLIVVILMIKPIFWEGKIIVYWLGNWSPIGNLPIGIGLEVDALSLFVALIISIASVLSSIYSLKYMSKDSGLDKYYALFLLLCGSMIGFVFTGDLFNMYVMLEIMTFAAIALTAFRSGIYKSIEAGFKYMVIGSIGSSFILIGTALIYSQTNSLNLAELAILIKTVGMNPTMLLALAMLLVGYAVKSFMVPCHTWPPDAHMSAPSSISMILSGVMSKTGVYGLIRLLFLVFGLMGNDKVAYFIIGWGALTMVVGVSMALIQHDFKRLLAFHSVSQIGYIIIALGIGLFSSNELSNIGLAGGLYHMVNHATFKCLLFLCAGAVLYTVGTTDLNKISGLGKKMPFTMCMFFIGALAISGIPPFNGFVSKWLIYQAGMESTVPIVTVICLVVSVITLASMIKVGQTVFFGPQMADKQDEIVEIPWSMRIPMGILSLGCILMGLFPNFIMKNIINPVVYSIKNIIGYVNTALGEGVYSSVIGTHTPIDIKYNFAGIYDPQMITIIFLIGVAITLILLSVCTIKFGEILGKEDKRAIDYEIYASREIQALTATKMEALVMSEKARCDVFMGGEEDNNCKFTADDMYWGFKSPMKRYFDGLHKGHSGIVNDYVLWIVVTLAVVLGILYLIFM